MAERIVERDRFRASLLLSKAASSNQLKNSSQMVNVKNAARHGYTTISGVSCSSSLMRTKKTRTITASRMPTIPHNIHEGKNEPRILKVGAREHPAANIRVREPAGSSPMRRRRVSDLLVLRTFCIEQVSRLKG